MGLDFGGSLFPQQGLLQEDGILSEQWAQEGRTLKNIYDNVNTDHTILTATAGKDIFIKSIFVSASAATGGDFSLMDGGGGGTNKITVKRRCQSRRRSDSGKRWTES